MSYPALFLRIKAWLLDSLIPSLLLVSVFTFGHSRYHAGIRIVGANNHRNLFVVNGIVRFIVKTLFGWISFALMLVTRRHQSLHLLVYKCSIERGATSGAAG